MNSQDKDFIDNFFDYFKPFHASGVRFLALTICWLICFILGLIFSPKLILLCQASLPFTIEFLQLSPLEVLFNYIKIAFFFAFFLIFPFFIYQFGKLKIEKDVFSQRLNLLYVAATSFLIILLSAFLTYKFLFPWQIIFFYGLNFDVAFFSSSLSAMVSTFIFTLFATVMVIFLPLLRNLIKKSLFFNYATLIQYRKPVIFHCIILSILIILPMELIALIVVFLFFFFWYKILVNFSKKRD